MPCLPPHKMNENRDLQKRGIKKKRGERQKKKRSAKNALEVHKMHIEIIVISRCCRRGAKNALEVKGQEKEKRKKREKWHEN